MTCLKCGRTLSPLEIALHRKLISRAATEFFCLTCLADYYDTTEEKLTETAERFREQGCTLFG